MEFHGHGHEFGATIGEGTWKNPGKICTTTLDELGTGLAMARLVNSGASYPF